MIGAQCTWKVELTTGYAFAIACTGDDAMKLASQVWNTPAIGAEIAPWQGWNVDGVACFHEVAQ